tara:strand:+ start:142 stop:525 length:384 start_codon:yes stop_codon:yes gene_type:complete
MKKVALLILALIFTLSSCKNDDDNLNNTCNVSDPIKNFGWLKEIIIDIEQSSLTDEFYISQAIYKGETVFIVGNCCALCNSVITVHNCEGEQIARLGYDDGNDFVINFDILERDSIIWSSPNFICTD